MFIHVGSQIVYVCDSLFMDVYGASCHEGYMGKETHQLKVQRTDLEGPLVLKLCAEPTSLRASLYVTYVKLYTEVTQSYISIYCI